MQLTKEKLEKFKDKFLSHYSDILYAAAIDQSHNLILRARPDRDFDEILDNLNDVLKLKVDFTNHLPIRLYPFVGKEYVSLSINPPQ